MHVKITHRNNVILRRLVALKSSNLAAESSIEMINSSATKNAVKQNYIKNFFCSVQMTDSIVLHSNQNNFIVIFYDFQNEYV